MPHPLQSPSSEMPGDEKVGRLFEDSSCQPPKLCLFCRDGNGFWSPLADSGKMGVRMGR